MTSTTRGASQHSTNAPAALGNQMSPVVVAEVALALVTLAAIAGLARLYRGASFFFPLAALAVAGHLLAAACRRWRLPPRLVAPIAVVSGVLLIIWLFFGQTTVLGVPTLHTFDVADAAIHHAWGRFGVVVAPAPALAGFQVVAAVAVWAGIWFADWSAFRLWASAESLAPAAVLFIFGSMLGAREHRLWTTLLVAAAALGFMLAHRIARQEGAGTWVASAPGAGRRSLARVGGTLGAVALIGGAVIGPHVPGAGNSALLNWRNGSDANGSRITVSPLVDIRKRLVQQSNDEAFNVRSDRPAYWRLTSLDTFDGRIWSSGGSFAEANGVLPHTDPTIFDPQKVHQEFQIGALDAIWAPAAFEASNLDPGDNRMRWDAGSATLIVDEDHPTSDGALYTVDSKEPQFTKPLLRSATELPPAKIRRDYLGLPKDFNAQAVAAATRVTRGGATPFDRALKLQNWFQEAFTYDINVSAGHSDDAIGEFLRTRRGYCEQFAGTYAAMARSIGLPSRVAVGFTPGDVDESDPDWYHVKGKHAHAWPEVWLGKVGWVAFEPTPGRGAPGASYTGLPARQDSLSSGQPSNTVVPTTIPSSTTPSSQPKLDARKFNVDAGNGPAGGGGGSRSTLDNPLVLAILALVVVAGAYALASVGVPRLRRRRARAHAVTAADRVALAWNETSETVARSGSTMPFSSETHHEYAARVAPVLGPSAPAHRELASLASRAAWSDAGADEGSVTRAQAISQDIRLEIIQRRTTRDRVRSQLDPHRLVRSRGPVAPPRSTSRTRRPVDQR